MLLARIRARGYRVPTTYRHVAIPYVAIGAAWVTFTLENVQEAE